MAQNALKLSGRLNEQILNFGRRVARSCEITAAYMFGGSSDAKTPIEVILIIKGFQSKLMTYVTTFEGRNAVVVAVDQWVFERDVDRGFLGEALVWRLIFPYAPILNKGYLSCQEVKLKKRLVTELLENLVLDFPELSYELRVEPEYFVYETVLTRVRLFPPMIYALHSLFGKSSEDGGIERTLEGYREGLKQLEEEGSISFENGYLRMSSKLVSRVRNSRTRLVNLSKTVPRALFSNLLGILPRIMDAISWQRETPLSWQRIAQENSKIMSQIEVPEKHLFVPTASGLVSLANKTGIESFARKILHASKTEPVKVEPLGGILNDVYLVRAVVEGHERKVVVKRFRDWSGFKWFPLTLWSVGTRSFAVLGRTRLQRECAINQLLGSRGFAVPKLFYVSPDERLIFMEYLAGEDASMVIKRISTSAKIAETRKDLKIVERIGRRVAKAHAIGVALGDTKPENILIGERSEIYFMDFEQSSRNGDKTWDVAEFLYYSGHYIAPFVETWKAEAIADAFIAGYLEAGGDAAVVRKAANAKYTKVFSVFTLPLVMLAISNRCRNAERE